MQKSEGDKKGIFGTLSTNSVEISKAKIILKHDHNEIKKILSGAAMMYEYYNAQFQDNWISVTNLAMLSLSDNQKVLLHLCKRKKLELWQDKGGWMGILNSWYNIIEGDLEALKQTVLYLKNIRDEYDPAFEPEIYWMVYQGFIKKDEGALSMGLHQLEQVDKRKKRIQWDKAEQYFSIQTTALAHQARKYGMQIEVESEFVPKEWLPYAPLNEYTIPYWFLRDFYHEQGVNWRYDPIYPELQEGL